MAFEHAVLDVSYATANADLSEKQYYIVKESSQGVVAVCTGATDVPAGILQNKPKSGEAAIVRKLGISKVRVNAAGLAHGTSWGTDNAGRAIAKTTDKDIVGGQCIEAAGATADLLATVTVNTLVKTTLSV